MAKANIETSATALLRLLFNAYASVHDRLLVDEVAARHATVTWVPRSRPILSASIPLDDFLRTQPASPAAANSWNEISRVREVDCPHPGFVRITSMLNLEAQDGSPSRTAEVLMTFSAYPARKEIIACCVVYDEPIIATSPITQVSLKRPNRLIGEVATAVA